jgi:hypothetical protein
MLKPAQIELDEHTYPDLVYRDELGIVRHDAFIKFNESNAVLGREHTFFIHAQLASLNLIVGDISSCGYFLGLALFMDGKTSRL